MMINEMKNSRSSDLLPGCFMIVNISNNKVVFALHARTR